MTGTDRSPDAIASIRWARPDYERIDVALNLVRERDHLEMSRAEFIRLSTRRMVEHVIQGGSVAAAAETAA